MARLFDGKCLKCGAMAVLHGRCRQCGYQSLDVRSSPGMEQDTEVLFPTPKPEESKDASSNENIPDGSSPSTNDSNDQDGTTGSSSSSE